jgi:hypothetical protein
MIVSSVGCSTITNEQLNFDNAQKAAAFKSQDRVSAMIGTPRNMASRIKEERDQLRRDIRNLKKKKSLSVDEKKALKQKMRQDRLFKTRAKNEASRLKAHKELFKYLSTWAQNMSAGTNYMTSSEEYLNVMNIYFRRFLKWPMSDMNDRNYYDVETALNRVKKWTKGAFNAETQKKMRDKPLRFWKDVYRQVAEKDVTGTGMRVMDLSARLPDNTWNAAYDFLDEFNVSSDMLRDWIRMGLTPDTINTFLFRAKDKFDVDSETGEKAYTSSFDSSTVEEKIDIIVNDYLELVRDLMDGRVRNISFKVIPRITQENPGALNDWEQSDDGKKVMAILSAGEEHRFHNVVGGDGATYSYVMIKQGEGGTEEVYNAYLVRRKPHQTEGVEGKGQLNYKQTGYGQNDIVQAGLLDGFFEASEERPFQYRQRTSFEEGFQPIQGTHQTSYYGFNRLENQPHAAFMGTSQKSRVFEPGRHNTVWNAIASQRNLFKRFYEYLDEKIEINEDALNIFVPAAVKNLEEIGYADPEATVNEILAEGGIVANIYRDKKTRRVYSSNSYLKEATENYDPRSYHETTIYKMLQLATKKAQQRKEKLEQDRDEYQTVLDIREWERENADENPVYSQSDSEIAEAYNIVSSNTEDIKNREVDIERFNDMLDNIVGVATPESINKLNLNTKLVHTKSREEWTDGMQRDRTNNSVIKYINNTVRGIHYNELKIELLRALSQIKDPALIDFLVNRTKISTGNLDYHASFLGINLGYGEVSRAWNKITGMETTPEGAHAMSVAMTMWFSSNLLGFSAAMTNNTQILAVAEEFGWRYYNEARKELEKENPDIEQAIGKSGVLDLLTWFTDMLAGEWGETPGWGTHKIDAYKVWAELKLSKSDFYRQKSSSLDRMAMRVSGDERKDVDMMKDLTKKQKAEKKNRIMLKKRGEIREILLTKDEKRAEKYIRKLNKRLSNEQIQKLLQFKMQTVMGFFGKNPVLTFTGSEQRMRKEAAIVGFLIARDLGLLNPDSKVPMWEQKPAMEMARAVVYSTMYGMSVQHLAEMFGGFGKLLLQFKPYTYHEMVREYELIENFMAGGQSVRRLMGAAISQLPKSEVKGSQFGDAGIDVKAQRMFRFITVRGLSTLITTGLFWAPFSRMILSGIDRTVGRMTPITPGKFVRSVESPLLAPLFRVMWGLAAATGMIRPDDEEKDRQKRDFLFQFISPIIGLLLLGHKGIKNLAPAIPDIIHPLLQYLDWSDED